MRASRCGFSLRRAVDIALFTASTRCGSVASESAGTGRVGLVEALLVLIVPGADQQLRVDRDHFAVGFDAAHRFALESILRAR